jgi:hypothetical protein
LSKARSAKNQRLYRVGISVAGGLLGLGLLYGLLSWFGARYVRSTLAERAAKYGRSIDVGDVSVFWPGHVSLRSLRVIHPTGDNATFPEIDIDYSMWQLLQGNIKASTITIKGGNISLLKKADGIDNFSDLLQRKDNDDTKKLGSSGMLSEASLKISGLSITADLFGSTQHTIGKITNVSIELPVSGEATLVLGDALLQEGDNAPVATADSVQVKLRREKREISLLGASIVHPELTLKREHNFGLPIDPVLSLIKKVPSQSIEVITPSSISVTQSSSMGSEPHPKNQTEDLLQRIVRNAASWEILDATLHLEDPSADGASITLKSVGVRFNAVHSESEGQKSLILQFYASGGAPGKEAGWSAEGSYDFAKRYLATDFHANQLSLRDFSPYMEGAKFVAPEEASLDFDVTMAYHIDKDFFLGGSFSASGLTIDHPKLAKMPLRNVSFSLEGELSYDFITKTLNLDKAKITRDKAEVDLTLSLAKVEGGSIYKAHAKMPKTKCGDLFASIPPELIPSLEDFKLDGTFDFDLVLDLDTRKLKEMKLDGNLDLNKCKVLAAGPKVRVSIEDLRDGSFMQHVEEPDGKVYDFLVGKDSDDWTPMEEISVYLRDGILTTEDGAFFTHRGFITVQVLRSIVENVVAGGFKRGASTITMQFVKNTLLTREKTISRKLQEMVLTWWVEQNLTKDRILTLYFNLIEFGPGIYGIHDAAEHYFESKPVDLTPWQAAFLLSIVPNPKKYHAFFDKNEVPAYWQERVRRILDHMHEKNRLTDEEWAAARIAPIVFGRTEEPTSQPSAPLDPIVPLEK